MSDLIVDMPIIERFGVGDCMMLSSAKGTYMQVADLTKIINWLTDDDDREVILTKLDHLKEVIS